MPYSMIKFDAYFRGQPNIGAGTESADGVKNMKRFLHKLSHANRDNPFIVRYMGMVNKLGIDYMAEVRQQFAAKHGRTGFTESTMIGSEEDRFGFGEDFMRYTIKMTGNVGFVLNPLPPHFIDSNSSSLYNAMEGPWEGRTQNFYSEFGPTHGDVYWYQGGAESASPDKSWYEEPIPRAAAMAREGFKTLGAEIAILWEKGGAK